MTQQTIRIDRQLWDTLTNLAAKKGRNPQALVNQLIREYLQVEEDKALFRDMRRDLRGREMTDSESVEFVHRHRREKRAQLTSRKTG
ncbi:MAG: hypothetical protein HY782_04910 [Chloroflexi bacterium]|nr:hypothetical protein [Chloroflexota bacterium]